MTVAAQMEPALVLHVRPYQESSAIVQMMTRDQGRLAGVLRGYRRKNRGQVAVQPFSVGTVSWVGRSDFVTIQKFESHHFIALHGEALYAGFYVLELLTRLLRERQEEPRIFAAALRVLEALEHADDLLDRRDARVQPLEVRVGLLLDLLPKLHLLPARHPR